MISVAALSIGAAFAGEDSTHRYHGTGPEWQEAAPLAVFDGPDSEPSSFSDPVVNGTEPAPAHETVTVIESVEPVMIAPYPSESSEYQLERYDYPG